jgi:predicted amidohydrolase
MAEAPILRVAAAQIPVGADMDDNLDQILTAMHGCAALGAELAVFPETALTGYAPAIGGARDGDQWPDISRRLRRISVLAGELGLWTVVGCEAWERDAWYNRLYVYSSQGELQVTYDKVHLMDADTLYYRPGDRPALFELCGIKIGVQICYDVRFPEGYRTLLHQGAQVIVQGFYGAGGNTWKVPVMAAHVRSRAAENGCFMVAANVSGPLQIITSQIVDPLGLVLAEANQDHSELIVADLHLERIADSEIRRNYLERHRNVGVREA